MSTQEATENEHLDVKIKDKVMLKSGGPVMEVFWIELEGSALCRWHDGEKLQEVSFDTRCLKFAE